jgi:hypothetical protein
MSYQRYLSASFGSDYAGCTTVGYALYNAAGTEKAARTTSGVAERGTATGVFGANVTLEDGWNGEIRWDTGDASPVHASEDVVPLLLDLANGIETDVTLRQAIQRMAAVIAGKVSGAGSGVERFVGLDGAIERVEVTVDAAGNRTNVNYDSESSP